MGNSLGCPFQLRAGPLQWELLPAHNRDVHMARNLAQVEGR